MGALADALVSRGGYNRTDAENAEKGPRAAELTKEFLGSSNSSSNGGYNPPSFDDSIFKQALALQQQAIEPVVTAITKQKEGLPAQMELTKGNLEATKGNLSARYDALLTELGRKQGVDESSVTLAQSREFGKRGVPLSSGVYDQALLEKTAPVKEFYAGQSKDVSLQKESDLLSLASQINALPSQLEKQLADLDLAIAEAKAGNSEKSSQILMSMGSAKQQADSLAAQLAQSASQFQQSESQEDSQFSQNLALSQSQLAEQQRQFNLTNSKVANNSTATKANTVSTAKQGVINMAMGGLSLEEVISKYGATLSFSELYDLYENAYQPKVIRQSVQ